MDSIAERYFALTKAQQKRVQIDLCERAYALWLAYVAENEMDEYIESVCGTVQKIDRLLPKEAIGAVRQGEDENNIARRYMEPITAMQDDDLEFSDGMEFAYYAIYNLFRFHVAQTLDDSWLIVNQALSALGEAEATQHLEEAVAQVLQAAGGVGDTAVFARTHCVICGSHALQPLVSLAVGGQPHGSAGHNFTYAYSTATSCNQCGYGQLEKFSHDCFHYEGDEDWDMYWWYALAPADVLRLRVLIDSCTHPLDAQCDCALHVGLRESGERLWSGVKHAVLPQAKTAFAWLTLDESDGQVILMVDNDNNSEQAAL